VPVAIALTLLLGLAGAALVWKLGFLHAGPAVSAHSEPDPTLLPPSSAATAQSALSLIERATKGDHQAIAELEARPADKRTPDESLALARGHTATKRAELAAVVQSVTRNPRLAQDAQTLATLERYALDQETAPEALRAIAGLPGPRGADLLYSIWTGTSQRNSTTELAEQLVYTGEVRQKASAALRVVLELRRTKNCAELVELLPRVTRDGDQRAVRPLARLIRQNECGRTGVVACFPCVRGNKQFNDAIATVEKRPPPE
jgi:hypothetical protein